MRYVVLLLVAAIICAAGCGKKEEPETYAIEPEEKAAEPQAKPSPEAEKPSAKTTKPGAWVKLPSGLEYKDIKVGSGPAVKSGDAVAVHYKGWLDNGKVFDTSKKPGGQPFVFQVGQGSVIPGWDQGIPGMKAGGTRELKIPPGLAYGDMEMGTIPANSTLHFTVDLLSINGKAS